MNEVIFRPAAAADVEDAYTWYEHQQQGLGDAFLEKLQHSVDSIAENPAVFAVLHRDTQRMLMERFPYGVFFRIYENTIVVVACMHTRQHPRRWESR